MSVTTLGTSSKAAERVAQTIQRRGVTGSAATSLWTSLAGAGAALALIANFVDWYAADRTATAWYSGFLPPIALLLITAAGALLVAKPLKLLGAEPRVDAELFFFAFEFAQLFPE